MLRKARKNKLLRHIYITLSLCNSQIHLMKFEHECPSNPLTNCPPSTLFKQLRLSTLSTNAARQLNILGHDCDTFCVNRTQVRVFKKSYQISLSRLLQG
mmetsp:Transcript_770/g.1629  ORF Transcript_770/g.1629 Transcript_770/m.1629 type:complete len:99 (-) Transcript_770:557-853(-)